MTSSGQQTNLLFIYRNMTTRDAISDLPSTNKGQKVLTKEPLSWLQRVIRWCPKKQSFLTQISHHEEWVIKSEIGKPIFQFKISPLDGTFLKVNSNCTFFNPNCVPFQAIFVSGLSAWLEL